MTPLSPVQAVKAQKKFFLTRETRPFHARLRRLSMLEDTLDAYKQELLSALTQDTGKPAAEGYLTELFPALNEIAHAKGHLEGWMAPRQAEVPGYLLPGEAWIEAEPKGVALIIAPSNFPLQLLLCPLVGCLAAGNCAVLCPSSRTPATSRALATALAERFKDQGVVCCDSDKEELRTAIREADHVFFTGGKEIGRSIMRAAADGLTPVTLELGGKNPCIIEEDADLAGAARSIVAGKFLHGGQSCIAPDFIAVRQEIHEKLEEELVRAVKEWRENGHADYLDSRLPTADAERLKTLLVDARIIIGKEAADNGKMAPVIAGPVEWHHPLMEKELFGPVLPLVIYRDPEELVRKLAGLATPLALYCFTGSESTARFFLDNVRSGGACINDVFSHAAIPSLPFGGLAESGMGRYHGKASFDTFSHHRSILRRPQGAKNPLERFGGMDVRAMDSLMRLGRERKRDGRS